MALSIEPKVSVVDYGPRTTLPNGQVITSDEFVWGASRITYKDIGAIEELRQAREEEKDLSETIKKSLLKSAGSGHASMATTPGLWIMLEGNCSKMVDSAFTGYRFASSLMPSGRRIPIALEQIVMPATIAQKQEARQLYMKVSEANIRAYELLQERGVPKEEAAKIVQYGHRGGGFMFMPLETIITVARDVKRHSQEYPAEIGDIVSQLEGFIRNNGMKITYEARTAAPRTGCPNPNIFHSEVNEAQLAIDANDRGILNGKGVLYQPVLQEISFRHNAELEKRTKAWLERRGEVFASSKRIIEEGAGLVHELQDIINSFNSSFHAVIAANIPWRVWGEDKRHRTLPLITESIYHAVERAQATIHKHESSVEMFSAAVSIPQAVAEDTDNLSLWLQRFRESVSAYRILIELDIPKTDALYIIPRGLKVGIVEVFDLYNLTTGHNSLRLCKTAEREKRETTEAYKDLILNSGKVPDYIAELLVPKCNYVGFCFEETPCGRVNKAVPDYDESMHKAIRTARFAAMKDKFR